MVAWFYNSKYFAVLAGKQPIKATIFD